MNLSADAVPTVCYDLCDSTYIQAESMGKVPDLCLDGSSLFYEFYIACHDCVLENGSEGIWTNLSTAAFKPYIDYCEENDTTTSTAFSIPTSWLSISESFIPTTFIGEGLNGSTVTTVLFNGVNSTSTLPAYYFHLNASSLISTFIPSNVFAQLAVHVESAASEASVTGAGDPTSLIYSALEDTLLPPWFQSVIPATYSTQIATLEAQINQLRAVPLASGPTTASPTHATSTYTTSAASVTPTSRAWIAGVVIGPIAGICLVSLGIFLLWRRRLAKKRERPQPTYSDKPELHADSLPAPPRAVYEMDGVRSPIELGVDEAPHELSAEGPTERPT